MSPAAFGKGLGLRFRLGSGQVLVGVKVSVSARPGLVWVKVIFCSMSRLQVNLI